MTISVTGAAFAASLAYTATAAYASGPAALLVPAFVAALPSAFVAVVAGGSVERARGVIR